MKLKKLLALLLTVVLLVASSVAVFPVNAAEGDAEWGEGYYASLTYNSAYGYSGGSGTSAAPYQIASAEDLAQLAANCNLWTSDDTTNRYGYSNGKYFELVADIDLKNVAWPGIGLCGTSENRNLHFKGYFDGNGYVISNLYIDVSDSTRTSFGLFGATLDARSITNVAIVSGKIEGTGTSATYIGSLIGYARNNNTTLSVENCYSFVDIDIANTTAACFVGGLIGYAVNYSGVATLNVTNCLYNGDIKVSGTQSLNEKVGGIIGFANSKLILTLDKTTAVTDIAVDTVGYGSMVGILIGATEMGANGTATLSACYAKGTIAATNVADFYRRGVIGYNYMTPINRTGSGTDEDPYAWNSNGSLWNLSCTKNGASLSAVVLGQDNKGSLSAAVNTTTNLGFASGTKNVDVSALNLLSGVGAQQRTVNDTFAVRFVGELLVKDYSNFASVGVLVSITYGESVITDHKLSSTSLYVSLNAEGGDITPEKGYLIAGGIYDVPNGANDEVTFTFKPYVELADGTVCYGETSATYTATAGALAVAQ